LSRAAPASAPLVSRYGVRPPGRSSGSRIILLSAPSHPASAKQWQRAEFVPGHSGGTATVSPSSLLNPVGYLGCTFIPKGGGDCQSYLQSGWPGGFQPAPFSLTGYWLLFGAKNQLPFLNRGGTACRALKPSQGNFFNAPSNKTTQPPLPRRQVGLGRLPGCEALSWGAGNYY